MKTPSNIDLSKASASARLDWLLNSGHAQAIDNETILFTEATNEGCIAAITDFSDDEQALLVVAKVGDEGPAIFHYQRESCLDGVVEIFEPLDKTLPHSVLHERQQTTDLPLGQQRSILAKVNSLYKKTEQF